MIRRCALGFGALALAMPAMPVAAAERMLITVGGCGGAAQRILIPRDQPLVPAEEGGCCDRIGCHASCDRQKRGQRRS
jgi:hypothetical protein